MIDLVDEADSFDSTSRRFAGYGAFESIECAPRSPGRTERQSMNRPPKARLFPTASAGLAVAAVIVGMVGAPANAAASTVDQPAESRGDVQGSGGLAGSPSVEGGIITVRTVKVARPGNWPVGIVPFTDAIYQNCRGVPGCMLIGRVPYIYGLSRLETTVKQYVTFLNTADPAGTNQHGLYSATEASQAWPKYGQINYSRNARWGAHYQVAYPQWEAKPYGFADFLRAARFANSVENGKVLARGAVTVGRYRFVSYRIKLSPVTTTGMYDLNKRYATRSKASGFVIPSQNEWVKAAYFDPAGRGLMHYWKYPTNPGVFGDGTATQPNQVQLNPSNGNVTNGANQPLANDLVNSDAPPTWCPLQFRPAWQCNYKNPFGIRLAPYRALYKASLSTISQARTQSPWATFDQGGNAVEWTDTITPAPTGTPTARVWRRLHGGVPNSTAYQMWPSAVGLQPQDNQFYETVYPWLGFRIGVTGLK